jgi:hypothetical protein
MSNLSLSPGKKQLEREAYQSFPTNADVKKRGSIHPLANGAVLK